MTLIADPKPVSLPAHASQRLPNGLQALAVARNSIPMAQITLSVPFARTAPLEALLLATTLWTGTADQSEHELSDALASIGAELAATVDADRLRISGRTLAADLPRFLEILNEVLVQASYPAEAILLQRHLLAEGVRLIGTQPQTRVTEALLSRMFRDHPYGLPSPAPDRFLEVAPEALRALHHERILPEGSKLVLVGDFDPETALELAGKVFASWQGTAPEADLLPVPEPELGPVEVIDHAGTSQALIRLGLRCPRRVDPQYPALALANLIFGGYFCSRLNTNLREGKGFSYSPGTDMINARSAALMIVSADVPVGSTGAALREIRNELDALSHTGVDSAEVDQARRYARGSLHLKIATQAGLAGLAADLSDQDLSLDWLNTYSDQLASTSAAEVTEVAARYLANAGTVGVVLGEAASLSAQDLR